MKQIDQPTKQMKELKSRKRPSKHDASETSEKKKNTENEDAVITVYSQLLLERINAFVITQCSGRLFKIDGLHEFCSNRDECVENFFEYAMDQIDEDTVKEMLKQKYITIYPSKADLKANKN